MVEITVYTSEPSVVCARVKSVLDARGFKYTEVSVHSDDERKAMVEKTGMMQCPLVYVGETLIGGLEATLEAMESGRFAELVSA